MPEPLANFIIKCEAPITIGVQGEWGSGKTSLLNMIREDIEEEERSHYSKTIKGSEEFRCIWINTWNILYSRALSSASYQLLEEIIDEDCRR